ncbi:MAG TPA: serine hydrolase domain-containing protein [Thermoanaerobaculia bacterium]|nr:serine hydrolase domain-containing protein [Thermoanaerobaculia bacterium]
MTSRKGILLLVVCAALLQAQTPPAAQRARTMMEELRSQTGSPGLSAAVAVGGKVVWAEGFGLADLENQVPVSPESRFRLGSISKLITVAAVARLAETGKLDLDAPVQRYVPSFPEKGHPVTPRQLAGHLAGIRHYAPQDFQLPVRRYERLAEGLAIFQNDPLIHPPGTYLYSSYGYNLLGVVVEGAHGKDFGAAVDELVIQPLELKSTLLDDPARIVERRVRFYRRESDGTLAGSLSNERAIDSSYKWPSAGYLSTAGDLVRFGSAHLRDGYLKPETRSLLFTSQRNSAGEETGVGIGWRIGRDGAGRRFLHHGGAIEGGRAFILIYPEERIVVAILANLSGARFAEAEAQKLAQQFMETD